MKDIVIVGGGPAGLTAAVYGCRSGASVTVIEKNVFGGQIVNSPKVENIPGFAEISGDVFADQMLEQVMKQGAEIAFDEVTGVRKISVDGKDAFETVLASGDTVQSKTVILATGTTHRTLGLLGEENLIGNGISFCAVCDGDFYRDKKVVMIGGGNSAFVESSLLTEIVSKLIILQDMPFFTAEKTIQDQVLSSPNVESHVGTKILGYVVEDGVLKGVRYEEAGEEKVAECDGVFLAVGLVPENDNFKDIADIDERGYLIAASENCNISKTSGVFVAGDCRAKTLRQVATACSDGAYAAIEACNYIKTL